MNTKLISWCTAKVYGLIALSALLLSTTTIHAEDTFQEPTSKTSFPKEVSFSANGTKYTLEATGAAVRTKFFVKVYAIANYVENPVKTGVDALVNQILDGKPARQFTLHWLRQAESEKVKSGFIESLQKSVTLLSLQHFKTRPINT